MPGARFSNKDAMSTTLCCFARWRVSRWPGRGSAPLNRRAHDLRVGRNIESERAQAGRRLARRARRRRPRAQELFADFLQAAVHTTSAPELLEICQGARAKFLSDSI